VLGLQESHGKNLQNYGSFLEKLEKSEQNHGVQ